MADPAFWIGGDQPLQVPRTTADATSLLVSCQKQEHANLNHNDYTKLKTATEMGIENKFTLIKPVSEDKPEAYLDLVYSVT